MALNNGQNRSVLVLGQLEELNSHTSRQCVHFLLVLSFAFQEEGKIEDQQNQTKNGQENPEGRQSDNVDEHNNEPEKNGKELTEPKYNSVASCWLPVLRGLEAPCFFVIFI